MLQLRSCGMAISTRATSIVITLLSHSGKLMPNESACQR